LLALGLDINAMSDEGMTVFKIAQEREDPEFEEFVKSRGARDVNLFYLIEKEEKQKSAASDTSKPK
jgi:hypothetical protein